MNKSKKDLIKIIAKDDAKWNNSFADLNTLGYISNKKFTTYNPSKDPEDKAEYDRHWEKAKSKK